MALILLVDDDDDVRTATKHLLERDGHDVHVANDGLQGLNRVTSLPFDLAIVDLYMPVMDGLELIPKIRIQLPDLPVIAMSGGYKGGRGLDLLRAAERAGATATLAKPFTIEELREALEQVLPG